jgi:hypothetical protein
MPRRDTQTFSARWPSDLLTRLQQRSEIVGTNRSRLAEQYVEEGTRMDEHPGILFRGGPSGRRAAVAGGPDVWEIVSAAKTGKARGDEAVAAVAELLGLSPAQVRVAVRYYAAFPAEVDDRIARNAADADRAEAAWRREQDALA